MLVTQALADLTGLEPLAPDSPRFFGQMISAPLAPCDPDALQKRLYDEFRIEIPVSARRGPPIIRASFQGYNDGRDLDALLSALSRLVAVSKRARAARPVISDGRTG